MTGPEPLPGLGQTYGPDTIRVGDRIRYRREWRRVVAVHRTFVQTWTGMSWTHRVDYDRITGHSRPNPPMPYCRTCHGFGFTIGYGPACTECRGQGLTPKPEDVPDLWVPEPLPGGYVCSTCGTPVESEPCREHQPNATARMNS